MAYTTIDDPSAYFQTALYSGDSSSVTVTNDGNSDLQPDWLWFKKRNTTGDHNTFDTSRGLTERLFPNLASASDSGSNGISALTDGFTSGTFYGDVNASGQTFITWQWKANGGSTTTNDASATSIGSIDSVYQANTTAGFSIVTYTGTGSTGTIAHGLGATPTVIFIRRRNGAGDWTSYHSPIGNEKFLRLNSTNAMGDQATYFNDTSPTSTVFTVGSAGDVNTSSGTHVAYCFTDIQGYSKYGFYEGNNNSNGKFIYLGFQPQLFIVKNVDSTAAWRLYSNKISNQNGFNDVDRHLYPNSSEEEGGGGHVVDFLSNGIKIRGDNEDVNDANTYIYMAFAEHPFVSSKGVPCTAR